MEGRNLAGQQIGVKTKSVGEIRRPGINAKTKSRCYNQRQQCRGSIADHRPATLDQEHERYQDAKMWLDRHQAKEQARTSWLAIDESPAVEPERKSTRLNSSH